VGKGWGKGTRLKEPVGAAEWGAEDERTPPVLRPERREARELGIKWVDMVDYGENRRKKLDEKTK
jgi:hypothetical protein